MAIATSFWTKNGRILIPLGIKPTASGKGSVEVHKSFASVNIFQQIKSNLILRYFVRSVMKTPLFNAIWTFL